MLFPKDPGYSFQIGDQIALMQSTPKPYHCFCHSNWWCLIWSNWPENLTTFFSSHGNLQNFFEDEIWNFIVKKRFTEACNWTLQLEHALRLLHSNEVKLVRIKLDLGFQLFDMVSNLCLRACENIKVFNQMLKRWMIWDWWCWEQVKNMLENELYGRLAYLDLEMKGTHWVLKDDLRWCHKCWGWNSILRGILDYWALR